MTVRKERKVVATGVAVGFSDLAEVERFGVMMKSLGIGNMAVLVHEASEVARVGRAAEYRRTPT
jgi:hypothetical protein